MEVFSDKEFEKLLRKAAYGKSLHTVWDDFVIMSALSIANAFDFKQEREDQYMAIVKKYEKEQVDIFSQLFARMATALTENPARITLVICLCSLDLPIAKRARFSHHTTSPA